MNVQEHVLAQKYAQAFLNVFLEDFSLKEISHLEKLNQFLHERHNLQTYLKIPLGQQFKRDCFHLLLSKYTLPKSLYILSDLLIKHHRAYLFTIILGCIVTEFYKRQGYTQFRISSSHTLDQEMLDTIYQFLERATKKKILTTMNIDKTLIAGIRLQSNELLWESSIKKRLQVVIEKCNEEVL